MKQALKQFEKEAKLIMTALPMKSSIPRASCSIVYMLRPDAQLVRLINRMHSPLEAYPVVQLHTACLYKHFLALAQRCPVT